MIKTSLTKNITIIISALLWAIGWIQSKRKVHYHFFGCLVEPFTFYLAYPAYVGPPCGPPGFRDRPFRTLFTHGHLNDPTFVRPKESGFVGWDMHLKIKEWGNPADMSNLNTAEKSTGSTQTNIGTLLLRIQRGESSFICALLCLRETTLAGTLSFTKDAT